MIVFALLIAFSERLRDYLLKSQKILFGLCKDLIFLPLTATLRVHTAKLHHKSSEKTSVASTTKTKTSRMGGRFGRYLASWRYQRDMEEDFWKRDDEKQTYNNNTDGAGGGGGGRRSEGMTLQSVLVSEASGNSHSNGLAERLRGQANGAAGGMRERDRDIA